MPRKNKVLYGLLIYCFLAFAPHAMAQEDFDLLASSPLAACENSTRCIHRAYMFDTAPSALASIALEVLNENKYLDSVTQVTDGTHRFEAVFNAWQFKDDVLIAIDVHKDGSVLFIRSESREGKYDLGVNNRRVNNLIKSIQQRL